MLVSRSNRRLRNVREYSVQTEWHRLCPSGQHRRSAWDGQHLQGDVPWTHHRSTGRLAETIEDELSFEQCESLLSDADFFQGDTMTAAYLNSSKAVKILHKSYRTAGFGFVWDETGVYQVRTDELTYFCDSDHWTAEN